MNRIATLALLAAIASASFAQGPGEHGRPPRPPAGGGDDDRRGLHDKMRALDERLAAIERRFEDGSMSKEEEGKLREEAKRLQAERGEVEKKLRAMGPPPGGDGMGPGGDRPGPGRPPGEPGGPGEPGMGPGGPRPMRTPVSAEDREKAIAWLKENEPTRLERLGELKQQRPDEHERAMNQVAMEVRDLLAMKQNDPKRYERRMSQRKLDYRANELAEKIVGSKQDTAAERKELKDVLGQLFDLREEDREQELKRLEEELVRLKETMAKRRASKDKLVERRMEDMLGEGMEWEPGREQPGGPPPPPRER